MGERSSWLEGGGVFILVSQRATRSVGVGGDVCRVRRVANLQFCEKDLIVEKEEKDRMKERKKKKERYHYHGTRQVIDALRVLGV